MSMLRICEHPDCTILTLGALCLAHESRVAEERYPRGRPFPYRPRKRLLEVADVTRPVPEVSEPWQVRAVSLRGGS